MDNDTGKCFRNTGKMFFFSEYRAP